MEIFELISVGIAIAGLISSVGAFVVANQNDKVGAYIKSKMLKWFSGAFIASFYYSTIYFTKAYIFVFDLLDSYEDFWGVAMFFGAGFLLIITLYICWYLFYRLLGGDPDYY